MDHHLRGYYLLLSFSVAVMIEGGLKRGESMKEARIPSHQIDVVEIMKKIRQTATSNRAELTLDEKIKREAKSDFLNLIQEAQLPDYLIEEIRRDSIFAPYDPRTLYSSSRPGVGGLIGIIRKILRPITKLFINLDPLAHEVTRLSLLNNFYLKTMQDLIVKTSSLRVQLHNSRRRPGHQQGRDHNFSRQNQNHSRHRHGGRRESGGENRNADSRTEPRVPSTEEPQAQ